MERLYCIFLPDPDDYTEIHINNVGLGEFRLILSKSYSLLLSHRYEVRIDLNGVNDLILFISAFMRTGQKLKPCG